MSFSTPSPPPSVKSLVTAESYVDKLPPKLFQSSAGDDLPTPVSPEPKFKKHERYHIKDDNVVFVVEEIEFKVHNHFLTRESERFRSMVAPNGRVHVPGVTAKAFENLLDFFYEGMYDDFECTLDQWVSILRVSTLYELAQVRERAIREIDAERHERELDPVSKIELAQECDVPAWLPRAYEALCQRERGLDEGEAIRLGVVITNRLWAAREDVRREDVRREPTPFGKATARGFPLPARCFPGWDDSNAAATTSSAPEGPPTVWKVRNYDNSLVSRTVSEIFWPPRPPTPPPPAPEVAPGSLDTESPPGAAWRKKAAAKRATRKGK